MKRDENRIQIVKDAGMKKYFTVIELLVVIVVLAILMSMMLPALGKVRDAGYSIACVGNMKQHGIAVGLYASDFSNYFPQNGMNPPPRDTLKGKKGILLKRAVRKKGQWESTLIESNNSWVQGTSSRNGGCWQVKLAVTYLKENAEIFLCPSFDKRFGLNYSIATSFASEFWRNGVPGAEGQIYPGFSYWDSHWAGLRTALLSGYFPGRLPSAYSFDRILRFAPKMIIESCNNYQGGTMNYRWCHARNILHGKMLNSMLPDLSVHRIQKEHLAKENYDVWSALLIR